jgi:hypothetical protein
MEPATMSFESSESVAEMLDDEVTPSSPPPAEILRQLTGAPFRGAEAASEQVFSAPTRRIAVPWNHHRRVVLAAAGTISVLLVVAIAAFGDAAAPPAGHTSATEDAGYLAGKEIGVRLATPPKVNTALDITSDPPGAVVFIDGDPALGQRGVLHTNVQIPGLAPGTHVVELKPSPGFKPWQQHVNVAAGGRTKLSARLAKLRRR